MIELDAETQKSLVGFVDAIIQVVWDAGSLDGGDIQDLALEHGVLKEVDILEPCSEFCACAEVTEGPYKCYRKTY